MKSYKTSPGVDEICGEPQGISCGVFTEGSSKAASHHPSIGGVCEIDVIDISDFVSVFGDLFDAYFESLTLWLRPKVSATKP